MRRLCSNIQYRVAATTLAVALAASTITPTASSSSSPPLTRGRSQIVSISAPWPTSCLSPLAEAAEFLAEGSDPSLFWKYVELVRDSPPWVFACAEDSGGELAREGEPAAAVADVIAVAVGAVGQALGDGDGIGAVDATGMRGGLLDDVSVRLMELALSTRCVHRRWWPVGVVAVLRYNSGYDCRFREN